MNSLMYPIGRVASGAVAQNTASRTSTTQSASRRCARLAGSVESSSCCSRDRRVGGVDSRGATSEPFTAIACASGVPTCGERLVEEIDESLTLEGFAQEAQGSRIHGLRPDPVLRKSSHEDDRYAPPLRQQQSLQLDAAQTRHLQIGDHTECIIYTL